MIHAQSRPATIFGGEDLVRIFSGSSVALCMWRGRGREEKDGNDMMGQ